ncbi:MAG TPA: IS21 family transposase [Gemmatimonadales bacterium]|nr:IS21 family transposase [Gemmatimonadales bacterium]
MTILRQEQIVLMDELIRAGRVSGRDGAAQLGVTEGALRYRRQRLATGARDGRAGQATALDGYEAAVTAVLVGLAPTAPPGRPVSGQLVFEALVRDHGYTGSYPALVRYLRRQRGVPPVRAVRRVETPPGMQAQHDWLTEQVLLAGSRVAVYGLLGTLSHSRGSALWLGLRMTQVAWQTGHAAVFQSYGGVPRVVRIDNLKTAVAGGAGPTAVLTPAFQGFATSCGFLVDPCRVRTPSDKGKVERRVQVIHTALAPLFRQPWSDLPPLQAAVTARLAEVEGRLRCPATGTTIAEARQAERAALLPLPMLGEPFDVIDARRVHRDALVHFEGRQYSVPFAWIGRDIEVIGTAHHVVCRSDGRELARHPRHTRQRLLLDPVHYEGPSTARVSVPTPLGARGRAQVFQDPRLPAPTAVARDLATYVALVEGRNA